MVEFSSSDSTIGGSLRVNTGTHADLVAFEGVLTVGEDLSLELGQGDDCLDFSLNFAAFFPYPVVHVGGSANLHGDQGFDLFLPPLGWSSGRTLESLFEAEGGLEIDGFEIP